MHLVAFCSTCKGALTFQHGRENTYIENTYVENTYIENTCKGALTFQNFCQAPRRTLTQKWGGGGGGGGGESMLARIEAREGLEEFKRESPLYRVSSPLQRLWDAVFPESIDWELVCVCGVCVVGGGCGWVGVSGGGGGGGGGCGCGCVYLCV
jgi:hypothetical protein